MRIAATLAPIRSWSAIRSRFTVSKAFEISGLLLDSMLAGTGRYSQLEEVMGDIPSEITATTDAIEAAFGGRWGIWLSDTGYWWASYRGTLTAAEVKAGRVPFVRAETAQVLISLVQAQEDLTPQRPVGSAAAQSPENR